MMSWFKLFTGSTFKLTKLISTITIVTSSIIIVIISTTSFYSKFVITTKTYALIVSIVCK